MNDNVWYCVKEHIKMNDPGVANGMVEIWIDGVQTNGFYNRQWRGPNVSNPNNNSSTARINQIQIYKQNGHGILYIDQFKAATTRAEVACGGTPSDTTAPFVPENLATNPSKKTISWSGSFDPVPGSGLAGYHLRRCNPAPCSPTGTFQTIAEPATSYVDISAQAGVNYSYTVNAFDAAGNNSLYTMAVDMHIPPGPSVSNVTTSAASNNTNSISFAHTVLAGNNQVLVLCTSARDTMAGDIPVLSATRGGTALTKVRHDWILAGDSFGSEIWYLKSPPAGTANLVVTWTSPLSAYGIANAIVFNGVHQTTPIDAHTGNTGTTAAISSSITTVSDNALIMGCALAQDSNVTNLAGQTELVNRDTSPTVDGSLVYILNKASHGAQTVGANQSVAQAWAQSVLSLKSAP
jgi:hypothetical protein